MFPLLASTFLYGIYKYKSYKFANKFYLFIYLFTLFLFCLATIKTIILISNLGYNYFSAVEPSNQIIPSPVTGLSFLFIILTFIAGFKAEYLAAPAAPAYFFFGDNDGTAKPPLYLNKIINYLFQINNASNGLNNTLDYYWDYVETKITHVEFFSRVNKFQIPLVSTNLLFPDIKVDWTFKDKSFLAINQIKNLNPANPLYYSEVIHLLNQAGEYNRIFLTQNLSNLIETRMYDDVIRNILNKNFEIFLELPNNCQDFLL